MLFFGLVVFAVICAGSRWIYSTFYKGRIEALSGKFVFNWFLMTLIIAMFSCSVVSFGDTESSQDRVEQQR